MNTPAPRITGTQVNSHVLSASSGLWPGANNVYQWQRSTGGAWSAIPSATAATYTPATGDGGYTVRVVVTASNPDGSVGVASPATLKVPKS